MGYTVGDTITIPATMIMPAAQAHEEEMRMQNKLLSIEEIYADPLEYFGYEFKDPMGTSVWISTKSTSNPRFPPAPEPKFGSLRQASSPTKLGRRPFLLNSHHTEV